MALASYVPWAQGRACGLGRHDMPQSASCLSSSIWQKTAPALPLSHHKLGRGISGRRVPRLARPQAALYHLPDELQSSIQTGLGIAWMLALPFSALPILTGESKEKNEQRFAQPRADQGAENVRWTVMGLLSFIPFLNWLAWVFAAFDDEEAATLYYTYAFLYSLPYLANGLQLDSFAILSVLVGIAHVQIERIALTEPAEVELPQVLKGLLRAVPSALAGLGRYLAGLGSEARGRVQSSEQAARRRPDRKYLEERSRQARMELEEFDRKARERQQQQQDRDKR